MERLSKSFISSHENKLDPQGLARKPLPIKVLQFGEGGFLRGFVDWMIHRMNSRGIFNGKVLVVQPIPTGRIKTLNEQDGLYTLLRRGLDQGKPVEEMEVITSISRGINPYEEFDTFLEIASREDIRFIVSNTTEAGIVLDEKDSFNANPPRSFPGKLTRFLWERYKRMEGRTDKGFIILPCELIDRNGDTLKQIVCTLAKRWTEDPEFLSWIEKANTFYNTLVDGIMTGYPKDEIQALQKKLGYQDDLFDTGELFHLWVIEGPSTIRAEFPLDEAGMNVVWTHDMTPYRTRKVRILNGAHTMTALGACMAGIETVKESLDDPVFSRYLREGIFKEIIPVLTLPERELEEFAESVLERFANPFIKHYWSSIALNSCAKYKARVLPTLLEYMDKFQRPPRLLSWSLAALIACYRSTEWKGEALQGVGAKGRYEIRDDRPVLEFFYNLWSENKGIDPAKTEGIVKRVLTESSLWGKDISSPPLTQIVTEYLREILKNGAYASLKQTLQDT